MKRHFICFNFLPLEYCKSICLTGMCSQQSLPWKEGGTSLRFLDHRHTFLMASCQSRDSYLGSNDTDYHCQPVSPTASSFRNCKCLIKYPEIIEQAPLRNINAIFSCSNYVYYLKTQRWQMKVFIGAKTHSKFNIRNIYKGQKALS